MLRSLVGSEMCIRDSSNGIERHGERLVGAPSSAEVSEHTAVVAKLPVDATCGVVSDQGKIRTWSHGWRRKSHSDDLPVWLSGHSVGSFERAVAHVSHDGSAAMPEWIQLAAFVGRPCQLNRAQQHAVSYTHLRAHETPEHLVCRLLLEKKKKK